MKNPRGTLARPGTVLSRCPEGMLKIEYSLIKYSLTWSVFCSYFGLLWSGRDETWSELVRTALPELFWHPLDLKNDQKQPKKRKNENQKTKRKKQKHPKKMKILFKINPTRWIVYSASFSGKFRAAFWGCARLFGDYLEIIWEVFCEDFEEKTIQRVNAKTRKTVFFTI